MLRIISSGGQVPDLPTLNPDGRAALKVLKANKNKILKRFFSNHYQKKTLHQFDLLGKRQTLYGQMRNYGIGPEIITNIFGIAEAARKYLEAEEISTVAYPLMMAYLKFYELTHPLWAGKLKDMYRGFSPKLTYTQAMKELVSRGWVHAKDKQRVFEKGLYSVMSPTLPLVWPEQFAQQQDGIAFLEGWGIPGHTCCPSQEQGQTAFFTRSY